eukprot:GILI01003917.1.p1 GENE.GILI01003917.1~~GILI01003917.1.p1  ORF type:complete len:440 (+),score=60.23 GILI01003917.1:74-1393(+)
MFLSSAISGRGYQLLWLLDAVLCIGILATTAYTEIDWRAYMQEVEGFLGGDFVYTNLKGDTGPLVYPAGFVYFYSGLYYITDRGTNLVLAQWIFAGFYLFVVAIMLRMYNMCRVPMLYTAALVLSKRIHSIFLLRMFNDGIAMMIVYIAVLCFASRRWGLGCLFYSLAVSIKMNIFLFAPGLLCLLVLNLKPLGVIRNLGICAIVQLVLGLPFILTDPVAYLGKAFELGRVFDYKWTVNYKFMSEDVFVSKGFGLMMLCANVLLWAVVCKRRWIPRFTQGPLPTSTFQRNVILTLFESNLIGFACCRSMHYQFYVWAFHQIPLVLALSLDKRLAMPIHILIFTTIEWAFNTYPSTSSSSFMLMCGALMPLTLGIVMSRDPLVPNRKDDFQMIGGPSPFDVKVRQQAQNEHLPAAAAVPNVASAPAPKPGGKRSARFSKR